MYCKRMHWPLQPWIGVHGFPLAKALMRRATRCRMKKTNANNTDFRLDLAPAWHGGG
jgi:hypothetical protein